MKKNKKRNYKKVSMTPFVVGAAVGTMAGLLLAKKPGDELLGDLGENIDQLKEKAKDAYDNKDEIVERWGRNIKNITHYEIKNFVEPEYYSKEFDLNDHEVKEKIEETKEKFNDLSDDVENHFEETIHDAKKAGKKMANEAQDNLQPMTNKGKQQAKEAGKEIKDAIKEQFKK